MTIHDFIEAGSMFMAAYSVGAILRSIRIDGKDGSYIEYAAGCLMFGMILMEISLMVASIIKFVMEKMI